MIQKKHPFKKTALSLSVLLILLWAVLGTGTSLAWFSDTSDEVENIFHIASFDLSVEYRDKNGNWKDLETATTVFDDKALYEPGYVQVVYLQVKNNGSVPFKFRTAVRVTDYTEATNYFGQKFLLQDYLLFGIVTADSLSSLDALVASREQASARATKPLNNYSTDYAELAAGDLCYMAVIVTMPKDVNNRANYRLDPVPRVDLGLIVQASQLDSPEN